MKIYQDSKIGNVRKINQDYISSYQKNDQEMIFVLCDGMGGHNGGEVASLLTCQDIIKEARIWTEGTDAEITILGGQHSCREWVKLAESSVRGSFPTTVNGVAIANQVNLPLPEAIYSLEQILSVNVENISLMPDNYTLSNDKKTATLSIDNKKMKVSIISPENAAFDTMAAESLYVPAVSGSRSLAAYRRLIMRGIYSGNVDIAVQFTAYNSGEPEPWTFDKVYPLSEWSDGRIYESNGIVKNIKVNGTDMEGFVSSKLGYVLNVDENGEIPVIEPEYDRINSRITMTKAENIGDTVKIQAVSKDPRVGSMEYVFTIEEKKTFGKPEGMDKVEIKNITSSNSGHEPAFDGRLDTRWVCEGSQWMLMDFGEKMPVDLVSMSFYKGVQRVTYFEIYVSDDGENFTKVFSGGASGASNDYENFKLSNANARYMKIVCNGSSTGIWASINEIEMYNFK